MLRRWCHQGGTWACVALAVGVFSGASADNLVYRYEGEVVPYEAPGQWSYNRCDLPCNESLEGGNFVLQWDSDGWEHAGYSHFMTEIEEVEVLPVWIEWRFRSNTPISLYSYTCDGFFSTSYRRVFDRVYIFADAVVSWSGDSFVLGLEPSEFHTFRFESPDGIQYRYSVDGFVFKEAQGFDVPRRSFWSMGGEGSCGLPGSGSQDTINEWDFIRYGTLDSGEPISSTDPPDGFLDPEFGAGLDRFQVTFDAPNYVYIRDITVETTGVVAPKVIATRRREPPDPFDVEDDPRIVEIILDRPLPLDQTTRFIIDDGEVTSVVRYTLRWADSNGDGAVDLFDAALLQDCYGQPQALGDCRAFDLNRSQAIDFGDAADFSALLTGP